MFSETSETTVTEISQDVPSSSSACSQWFGKYRKYILVSLVAGLSLAVILALGLLLTTTPGRRKKISLALKIPSLIIIFSSRGDNNWWWKIRCEGGSVQY